MANPPAPDVEAVARMSLRRAQSRSTALEPFEWSEVEVDLLREFAFALTAHTASLREKVEELERERDEARGDAVSRFSAALRREFEAMRDRPDDNDFYDRGYTDASRDALNLIDSTARWLREFGFRAALFPRPADEPVTQGER